MTRHLTLPAVFLTCSLICNAQAIQKDTLNSGIRNYQDEIGYFQIANRDMGDPLFMFHDEKGKIDLGIGGTAKVSAFYGFAGEIPTMGFDPTQIMLPTESSAQYGMRASGSEIHVKARSWIGTHKIIAYVKFGSNDKNSVTLSQAYLSLDGFSIGLIPSFFMDREVGAMTTGMANGSTIDITHPLVGYTARLGEHVRLGIAAEQPNFSIDYIDNKYLLSSYYQPMPDFSAFFKYKFDNGHLQTNAIFRNLSYWEIPVVFGAGNGEIRHVFGYGGSISGHLQPVSRLKLTWQVSGGTGISSYLADLGGTHNDVAIAIKPNDEGHYYLKPVPVSSGMLSAEFKWTDKLSSALLVTHTHNYKEKTLNYFEDTRDCLCATANLFWYMSEYAYLGAEYLFGRKAMPLGDGELSGVANRVVAVIAFCF